MSFFKRLFGEKSEINSVEQLKMSNNNNENAILKLFKLDLSIVPDRSFIVGESDTNVNGELVQNYHKTLDYKEYGIFDTVEVKVIQGEHKNIIFKSYEPSTVQMDKMKKLLDDLFLIYGYDSSGKGGFTNIDIKEYQDTEYYMLFGRSWSDYPKYKFPVTVTRDEDHVSITVWGVDCLD